MSKKIIPELKRFTKLTKILVITIVCILLLVSIFIFIIFRSVTIEEYCTKNAHQIVQNNWDKEYILTPQEMKKWYFKPGDKPTWGYIEELKCDDKQKIFFFF